MSEGRTVFRLLETLGLPVVYGIHTERPDTLPYLALLGDGQYQFPADDTYYYKQELYQAEYYFRKKDPEMEQRIEQLLLDNGYLYDKSEDTYLNDQGVFLIYYNF